MDITTILIIIVVVIVAWILLKLVLKITGFIFRIGCLIIFELAALAILGAIFI
jgi:hypothetical protein